MRGKRVVRFCLVGVLLCFSLVAQAADRDASRLQLASVAGAVAPLSGGDSLVSKRGDWVLPIASITKLMTAIVVLDSEAPLDEWLKVVPRDYRAPANAYSRIRQDSEARRRDLLQIALMSSENLASYLLARHHPEGYDAFVEAMNAKARELGMTRTRFVDSTGLSGGNESTAEDLVILVRAAWGYPLIRDYSIATYHRVSFRSPRYSLDYGNTNPLTHSSRWSIALSKTGYLNAAGRCLVMVAELEGEPMVVVLLDSLGTRTPLGDAGRIRRWLANGETGVVADAAGRYEREKVAHYEQLWQQVAGQPLVDEKLSSGQLSNN